MNEGFLAVKKYVASVRWHLIYSRIVKGILPAIFLFITLSIILDISFAFYPWILLALLWDIFLGITVVFITGWIIDAVFIHPPDLLTVSSLIEKEGGPNHSLLSIALEFSKTAQTGPFIDRIFEIAASQIKLFPSIKFKKPVVFWLTFLLLPVWFLSIFYLDPSLISFWKVPLINTAISGVSISPGTVKIGLNDKVTLSLLPGKTKLPSCRVVLNRSDSRKKSERYYMRPDSTGAFSTIVDSVKNSFVYQFFYGGKEFSPDTITVVPPPALYSLQLKVYPPAYTGDSIRLLPEGMGNVKVYAGTKVEFTIESEELSSAFFIPGKDSIPMTVRVRQAFGEVVVNKETDYTFLLFDLRGQKSDSLPMFHIDIIPDEKPLIHFLKPGFNTEIKPEQIESLWVEGIDDIGIRSLELYSCRNGECQDDISIWNISPDKYPKSTRKQIVWNLNKYSLYPGDTLFYWAKIRDNNPYSPPGISYSDTFWFRVPDFHEIHNKISEKENYTEEKIENVRSNQDELNEMLESLVKSATGKQQLSWDQQQILQDAKKTIQAQSDSLQNALKSLEESVEKLKQQGSTGDQISQKMEQIQKELREIVKLYGDSLLQNFKQDNPISMDQMRNAVENLQKMLPELSDRLDNTLQFLEMLRKDRQIAKLAMQAEKLAQQQNQLAEQNQRVRAAEQQKNLLSEIKKFNQDLKREFSDDDQLLRTCEQMNELQKDMASDLAKGLCPSVEKKNNMSSSLLTASQQLNNKMSSSRMKQMQKEKKIIMDIAHDLLNLADWQEMLLLKMRKMESNKIAVTQQAIHDALKKVSAKVESLKVIPPVAKNEINKEFLKVIQNSGETVSALEDNSGLWAMKDNKSAFLSLSYALLKSIQGMNPQAQSQGSGGLMDALRNLSGTQAAINAATSELLKSLLNGSEGTQMEGQGNSDALKESRDAQNALAEELRKLAQKYGNEAGEGAGQKLQQLEQEARRIARMLEQPQTEISRHQDIFLSRLLQATLSMNRQGEGKEERKSKAAETIFSDDNNLGKKVVNDNPDSFYLLRQKALMGNFPDSYRELIKEYFDSLEVLFLNK